MSLPIFKEQLNNSLVYTIMRKCQDETVMPEFKPQNNIF